MSAQGPTDINLDEAPPDDAAPAWPLAARLRQLARPWSAVCALALVPALLLVLAGDPPAAAAAQLAFRAPADHYHLGEHHLYTVNSGPDDVARITAHELPSGRNAWHRELPAHPEAHFVDLPDGHLVVTRPSDLEDVKTSKLDWQTGELLWTSFGSPVGATAELVVLRPALVGGPPPQDAAGAVAVDRSTGAERWQLPPAVSHLTADPFRDRWYGVLDGELVRFDSDTGEVMTSVPAAEPEWRVSYVASADSALLVQLLNSGERTARLRAYDPESLAVRWELASQVGPDDTVYPLRCGDLLCLGGDGSLRGVDPDTGEPRWLADDPVGYVVWHAPTGAHHFSDHLVVVAGADPRGPQQLLSAATGEPVAALPEQWWLVPGVPGTDAGSPPLAIRESAEDDDRRWLGALRPDSTGVEPLRVRGGEPPHRRGCVARWPYLACPQHAPGRQMPLAVWRIDAPNGLW